MSVVAPRRALLALALVAGLATALPTTPAVAAMTSSGVRCTIVGTAKADVLIGTPRRDVICGLGGNDVIRARGGNDLIDGGPGRDVVRGGAGADRILGGPGGDRLLGGVGRDSVSAGRGRDVVSGGGGEDALQGGGEGDTLDGNAGDDEITSGPGVDDVDGGRGDNLCIVEAEDESIRCRYDEEPPVVLDVQVGPSEVDVTSDDAEVRVRVHVTDDTGVDHVQGWLQDHDNGVALSLGWFELDSGTARDGWWAGRVTVPRHTPPGELYADLWVTDRQGRSVSPRDEQPAVQVNDSDPDLTPPGMTLTKLTPASIDVHSQPRAVTVEARVVDQKTGVTRLDICLARPGTVTQHNPHPLYEAVACETSPQRISGTTRDGVWRAVLTVPKGSVGATYNVVAYAEDRVSNNVWWNGPEAEAQWTGWCCTDHYPFPDDAGRVEVIGIVDDQTPAWVDAVTASKTELDTLAAADSTHVRVHALDAAGEGEGVTVVEALLVSDESLSSDPQFQRTTLEITSGTVTDGWWEGDVVAPQGTPPGTYHLLVGVSDRAHGTMYTDPEGPFADGVTYQPLAGMPIITVVDRR